MRKESFIAYPTCTSDTDELTYRTCAAPKRLDIIDNLERAAKWLRIRRFRDESHHAYACIRGCFWVGSPTLSPDSRSLVNDAKGTPMAHTPSHSHSMNRGGAEGVARSSEPQFRCAD